MQADIETQATRWSSHPLAARAVRVGVFVVPFITAMVVAYVLSARLPIAITAPYKALRWIGIVAASSAAMMLVDRVARRLLPLSALLQLTLVFPDQAPSRFNLAMRTGTTAQLKKRLAAAREVPDGESAQHAAERVLELVALLSQHDRLTRGHSERVRAYTHLIGEELGLTDQELDKLRWAGLLHDIGKTAIAPEILNKPGQLSSDEYAVIQTHPDEGRALVGALADWLGESVRAVWEHHERFDGTGYPRGLAGVDISFAARVVSVADSYDVMTSARSYKQPMSAVCARAELAACAGTQFDPVVVRAFMNISLGRLRIMSGPLAFLAQLALFEPSGVAHAGTLTTSGGSAATVAGSSTAGLATTGAVTGVAASTGSAGIASTVVATAMSVLAGTAGIVAAGPASPEPVAAPETVAVGVDAGVDAGALGDLVDVSVDTIVGLGSGGDAVAKPGSGQLVELAEDGAATDSGSPADAADSPPSTVPTPTSTVAESVLDRRPSAPAMPTAPGSPAASPEVRPAPPITIPAASPPGRGPETTTTTTVSTTVAPASTGLYSALGSGPVFHLGGGVLNDSPAHAYQALVSAAPPAIPLPNFDTDRDSLPGVLVTRSADGFLSAGPSEVVVFAGQVDAPMVIDAEVSVDVWIADDDFGGDWTDVEVGLFRCSADGACELIGSDAKKVNHQPGRWGNRRFNLGEISTSVGVGERLELRIGAAPTSTGNALIGFGTQTFDSTLTFVVDDDD